MICLELDFFPGWDFLVFECRHCAAASVPIKLDGLRVSSRGQRRKTGECRQQGLADRLDHISSDGSGDFRPSAYQQYSRDPEVYRRAWVNRRKS